MRNNRVEESVLLQSSFRLDDTFYLQDDVVDIAKKLLGKIVVTNFGILTASRITETEAYKDITDKASHSYGGRRTKRTEIMYAEGGTAYIYLCYGVHSLFNIITNKAGIPDAVLIRAGEPVFGIEKMLERSNKSIPDNSLTSGPGNFSKAMGIHYRDSGIKLSGDKIYLIDDGKVVTENEIITTTRIGVDYAGEDALRPYRFYLGDSDYVSRR